MSRPVAEQDAANRALRKVLDRWHLPAYGSIPEAALVAAWTAGANPHLPMPQSAQWLREPVPIDRSSLKFLWAHHAAQMSVPLWQALHKAGADVTPYTDTASLLSLVPARPSGFSRRPSTVAPDRFAPLAWLIDRSPHRLDTIALVVALLQHAPDPAMEAAWQAVLRHPDWDPAALPKTLWEQVVWPESPTELPRFLLWVERLQAWGQDLHRPNGVGDTMLHKHLAFAPVLLAQGASVQATNKWGRTPLHEAAMPAWRAAWEPLLAAGAAPHAPDQKEITPLMRWLDEWRAVPLSPQAMEAQWRAVRSKAVPWDQPDQQGVTVRERFHRLPLRHRALLEAVEQAMALEGTLTPPSNPPSLRRPRL